MRSAQFIEQPRILDGDDGLSGEVLDERDLLVGERMDFLTEEAECTDQVHALSASAQQETVRSTAQLN